MKTLFDASDRAEMLRRIERVQPDSRAQWGKMNASQMLAHCQAPLRVASGEVKLPRSFLGVVLGRLVKKKATGPVPYDRNLPTHKSFIIRDARDHAVERDRLIALVRAHGEGGAQKLTSAPHPFFGRMSVEQWQNLMWKHLDHHLRQFGA